MTHTLVVRERVAVSPGLDSSLAPSASVRKPSRTTSASLLRGDNRISALVLPPTRCPGATRSPSIDPQSAAPSTASDNPPGAPRRHNGPVNPVMSGMLLGLASVMLHRAYANSAQRLARRDGGGG